MPGKLFRAVCVVVALCAAAPAQAQRPAGCSTVSQNLFVRDVMTDIYLWYDAIPDVNPVTFRSPEAYLDAIRFRPLDETFSYITSRDTNEAFFSDSQYIGYGFSTSIRDAQLRVTQVFAGSPAADAGFARGDLILAINGRPVADLIRTGQIGDAFGPSERGVERDIAFERNDQVLTAHIATRVVTIPTVSVTRVYRAGSRTVGYVFFSNFVEPSVAALDGAFAELRAAGVNELVLDLRYNGGGLVSVAQHLASLIGGVRTEGQVLATSFHNDKHAALNETRRFEPTAHALALDRLIVITTHASASASELVINALRPFMPVIVIGGRTYGKPVGQYAIPFCDKVLAAVAFSLRNADDQGDFFDGFPPTCGASDDLGHQFGDPLEASLREALVVIDTGRCSAPQAPAGLTEQRVPRDTSPRASGWQAVVGAS